MKNREEGYITLILIEDYFVNKISNETDFVEDYFFFFGRDKGL